MADRHADLIARLRAKVWQPSDPEPRSANGKKLKQIMLLSDELDAEAADALEAEAAQVEELERALKPFATFAESISAGTDNSAMVATGQSRGPFGRTAAQYRIVAADFRDARAVLKDTTP